MKNALLLLIFVCIYTITNGQSYAIIKDNDGYVNVRAEKNASSAIRGKIYAHSIFSYDADDKGNWIAIYQQKDKNWGLEGYVSKTRIQPLSSFKQLEKLKQFTDSCINYNDNLKIIIKAAPFKAQKRKLTYSKPTKTDSGHWLVNIDNKPFWGADGGVPKRAISSVQIIIKGINIPIPKTAYDDLFEPNFYYLKTYIGKDDTIYIRMDNSDGAGGYTVIWVFKDGKYYGRYIDNSEA